MATKGKVQVNFALRYVAAIRANRYVALPLRYSTIAYKDILYYAAKAAHVPESAIEVAMDALYDALSYFVLNGHNVKIDGLGTFYFGINAYAMEEAEYAGADAVHRLKIGYLPDKELRMAVNNVAITTLITNPGDLAVDESVPAVVNNVLIRSINNQSWRKVSFGGTYKIPEEGAILRFVGARLNRESLNYMIEMYDAEGEQQGVESEPTLGKNTADFVLMPGSDQQFYLGHLRLRDSSTTVFELFGSWPEGINMINKVVANGKDITLASMPVVVENSADNVISFYGANVPDVIITGCSALMISSSPAMKQYRITEITGNVGFSIPIIQQDTMKNFSVIFNGATHGSSASSPVVTSLAANGISVANGGSSTVQAGQSYNFVFSGANLSNIKQSNLVVPSGATVSNFAASASQVSFRLTIGEAGGNIGLNYNGASLFSVSVTIPTNISASITSIGGVANNGTLQVTPSSGSATVSVVGTGLDTLSASNFVMSGYTMTLNEGTATERQLTIRGNNGFGGGTLRVQVDSTTIYTVTIDAGDEVSF